MESSEVSLHRAMSSAEYLSDVDADGRQETMRETITTDLEIKFTTDVEVRIHYGYSEDGEIFAVSASAHEPQANTQRIYVQGACTFCS